MKSLLLTAAILALTAARPETYKETEDFQYSRSSTDEGSKSGYYGAQRGNMGGNYEKAHNMDGLAQHQMSTAVKQVEGELGEAAKMNSGNVFTSANSGSMFGSRHYDVSNLQGRNFQESASSYGAQESQSHSALSSHQSQYRGQQSSSALHNSGYNGNYQNSGYRGYQGTKSHELQSGNFQVADNVHDTSYGVGAHQAARSFSSGQSSQTGYESRTYGSSNANQYDSQSAYGVNPQQRIVYATPVRIYGRPGTRVAVPLGVQTYDASASTFGQQSYDAAHSASSMGHAYDATHSSSTLGQHAYNGEAEVLSSPDQHVSLKPNGDAKHYESSYSYRKQWEKHDTQTEAIGISTDSPFPKNSELYEDAQTSSQQQLASGYNSHSGHSSSIRNGYNANVKSSSASQIHQSAAASQHSGSSLTHGAYTGDTTNTANVLNGIDTKPKSYQSSYSYHKSWERQGDPYVIKPVGESYTGVDSQRLTAASKTNGYSSHQSHQGYSQGNSGLEDCDCDVNGYRRVTRSLRNQQQTEDLTQQSQTSWGDVEDLGQHTQNSWDRPADVRQNNAHRQTQGQIDEKFLGGQSRQSQRSNLEDLGQHAQSGWDKPADLRQKYASQQAQQEEEDFGQQVQQNQWSNLEDLGQHAQSGWGRPADLRQKYARQQAQVQQGQQDFGQQVQQNQWSNFENLGQHAQSSWDKPADLRQKYAHEQAHIQQESEDFGQQVQQNQWDISRPVPQRQSDQDIVNKWPGYISEKNTFENQEQQSSYFKPNWPGSLEIKYEHTAPESSQTVTSKFNQEQQESYNTWFNQAHQLYHTLGKETSQKVDISSGAENTDQIYKSHDQQMEPQANKPLWEYSEQHKNSGQWLETTMPSSWFTEHSNFSYKRQNQSDWSQAAHNSNTDSAQISSLWDKISEVDGVFLDTNVQQIEKDQEKVNLNQDQGQYHDSKLEIHFMSTTIKPNNTANSPKEIINQINISNTTQKPQTEFSDVGRGDIGPEENISEEDIGRGDLGPEEKIRKPEFDTNINTFQVVKPISIPTENNKGLVGQFVVDEGKQINITEDSVFHRTEGDSGSWSYYSGSSYKNQSSHFNKNSEHRQENIAIQNQHRLTDFESSALNPGQQKYKVDKVELEPINQDIYQNWQQSESDTQTLWGQSLESFIQIPHQNSAETFGVKIKDKELKPTVATLLAESFKRQSVEDLDKINDSNHALPQYIQEQQKYSLNTQTQQNTANTEVPVETTTSKPGFWKNAKNKFMSLFKSS